MLYLNLAWRNIWRNRRRTFITILSIVVAVMLSAVMRAMQEGQYDDMIENTVGTFTGYIQIHQAGYWEDQTLDNTLVFSDSLIRKLNNNDEVAHVVPRLQSFALAAGESQSRPALILGVDVSKEQHLSNARERLQAGAYFDSNDEKSVLVGNEMMQRLGVQPGDSLVLIGQGFRGQSATGLYEVKGSVRFPSSEMNKNMVMLPLETAQNLFASHNRVTAIALMLDDAHQVEEVVTKLKKELSAGDYEIMGWQELMPELMQSIEADRGSGLIMIFILYMVVGFGILGTVLMMISERTYELGVMLAVGTPRVTILSILAIEMLVITFIGVGVGVLISIPISWYFNINPIQLPDSMTEVMEGYGMEPVIQFATDPSIFYSQAVIVFIITLIFTIIPLIRASRLNPVKALRS
ncbi:MAG: ABC transporter permease [Gracilimonas sp.]|uniref:ABC transporter permease n=1 Tax=Gracilimonas TaxID=649462 RepID=UPI001B2CA77B|nr:ABC transporter permease [Gracilimonas sp.]MBO6585443.1 ABC transporter permease [Gracilimonas sp.]MBO6616439.1 ABC transporter permease [Gracilimonas sp.]